MESAFARAGPPSFLSPVFRYHPGSGRNQRFWPPGSLSLVSAGGHPVLTGGLRLCRSARRAPRHGSHATLGARSPIPARSGGRSLTWRCAGHPIDAIHVSEPAAARSGAARPWTSQYTCWETNRTLSRASGPAPPRNSSMARRQTSGGERVSRMVYSPILNSRAVSKHQWSGSPRPAYRAEREMSIIGWRLRGRSRRLRAPPASTHSRAEYRATADSAGPPRKRPAENRQIRNRAAAISRACACHSVRAR